LFVEYRKWKWKWSRSMFNSSKK